VFRYQQPTEPIDLALAKALAAELAAAPRLTDKDAFRALANRVKDKTGLKGKPVIGCRERASLFAPSV
jgi:hypothetical protein